MDYDKLLFHEQYNMNWNSVPVCGKHSFFVFLSLQAEEEAGEMPHDVATALRSDIAALQYKRDRLLSEVRYTEASVCSFQIVESSAWRLYNSELIYAKN